MSEDRNRNSPNKGPAETAERAPETGNTPSDLRSLIADTLQEQKAAEPQLPLEEPAPAKPEIGEPAPSGEPRPAERERGPGEEGGEEKPGAEAAAATGTGAPQHWAAPDKATFNALPDAAKAPFLDLYKRMEKGFQPRLERAATYERDYAEIDQLFGPHRERLRVQGRGPKEILQIWYNTEAMLATASTRDECIANLIHAYGGDPVTIARHLNAKRGFAATPPAAGDGGYQAPGYQTPVSPDLQSRLAVLENAERQRLEAEIRGNLTNAQTVYEEFAKATDSQGNLLHPDLAELDPQMTQLAQLDRAQGKPLDLQDLYNRAAWMTDSTRQRLLDRHQQAEQRKAADERRTKAEAARRAASSVTGAPSPGAAPQDVGASDRSIRDEIRAQMNGRGGGRV